MKFGDYCRSRGGAPARYVGRGFCLYVSAMTNDLMIDKAAPADGSEWQFPMPTDRECCAASSGLHAGELQ
jgi:hypothetical protein